jgi:hypothetical protein
MSPLKLVLMAADYVRTAAVPVSTEVVAAAITQGNTQLAGSALVTARHRGYVKRSYGRWAPGLVEPGSADDRTPRCTEPGCPVVYRAGPDRPCSDHRGDGAELAERMTAMGVDVTAAPAGRHDDGAAVTTRPGDR